MLGWTLLVLVLLILATLAAAFGVLQTGGGKREIASLARGALSGLLRLTVEIAAVGAGRVALNRLPPSVPTRRASD